MLQKNFVSCQIFSSQDPRFTAFFANGPYSRWEALDVNPERILHPAGSDTAKDLPQRRRELRTLLSLVAKCVDTHHFNLVTRSSTSLQSIYERLREYFHLQQHGLTLLNVIGLRYQPTTTSVGNFYHTYRQSCDSYDIFEFRIRNRILSMLFKNIWKLLKKNLIINQKEESTNIFYFTLQSYCTPVQYPQA